MRSNLGSPAIVMGAGFIGKNLIRRLIAEGVSLRVLDHNECPTEFQGIVEWIKGDFHNRVTLERVISGIDTVYHLISSTVPGDLHINVADEIRDNVLSTLALIDLSIKCGVRRVVFTSSASVYGVQEKFPINESAHTNPISVHGIHKLMVEKFLLLANWKNSIDIQIVRLSNPYGPGQSLTGRQGFIAIAIGCLLRDETLTLRGQGEMIRDFIFVEDAVLAIAKAGATSGKTSIYNIGYGKGYSLAEVLNYIEAIAGKKIVVDFAESRKVDIPISILDISLAGRDLDFSPSISLAEGIKKTLKSNGMKV
ncbi:NAD-dependent epimerase/dehydratase family protein [Spirulina sp. CCNP1310]|uniref:NAD-dependent epimerase/dehydratase family protein n=1 Tax=Spirulina sp. CCNP1310 TaxID=3110249 RepID=UPI002B21B9C7|nr:NAD-dependent epimerase/dehydratase family protein [Spirulina sp. CCNP1310]MEA5421448.1 NAD-dependent epimerase/dehydratase family protein [Spirulina sp. CCNP1310]